MGVGSDVIRERRLHYVLSAKQQCGFTVFLRSFNVWKIGFHARPGLRGSTLKMFDMAEGTGAHVPLRE
jgi:hypothetical protein